MSESVNNIEWIKGVRLFYRVSSWACHKRAGLSCSVDRARRQSAQGSFTMFSLVYGFFEYMFRKVRSRTRI